MNHFFVVNKMWIAQHYFSQHLMLILALNLIWYQIVETKPNLVKSTEIDLIKLDDLNSIDLFVEKPKNVSSISVSYIKFKNKNKKSEKRETFITWLTQICQ